MSKYDKRSLESILAYAKKLEGKSLMEVCDETGVPELKSKGGFGHKLEKYYFGLEINSKAAPDFEEVGLELKSAPLKINGRNNLIAKERLVLGIINYEKIIKESFKESTFWRKNSHLLLVFYLHEKDVLKAQLKIKMVGEWKLLNQDLTVIRKDWLLIQSMVSAGRAHELSEGTTLYLGACTKGKDSSTLRPQPYSDLLAKQRAFSFKQGYVNHIIATLSKKQSKKFGRIIDGLSKEGIFEDVVLKRFSEFIGLTPDQILSKLGLTFKKRGKNYYHLITKAILGLKFDEEIEEFEKANIKTKTMRLSQIGVPKEDISFPSFKFEELVNEEWENSSFKEYLEQRYFLVVYQEIGDSLVLRGVKFWCMEYHDLVEAQRVWSLTKGLVRDGKIVLTVNENGRRKTFFPNSKDNKVSHVRPHARNSRDTYPLPVPDELTGAKEYTKHCFWLNKSFIGKVVEDL